MSSLNYGSMHFTTGQFVASLSRLLVPCVIALAAVAQSRGEQPSAVKHQITGLFSPDREADLREVVARLPEIALVSIDYANAEASFRYDTAKAFPGAKPEQIVERFDNLLRSSSFHTFGVKPLRTAPLDKLKLVEIPAAGLDCKGCCLGAYEAIYKLPGVERATASFKEGRVTALVDLEKTDRAALEAALKQRGVELKTSREVPSTADGSQHSEGDERFPEPDERRAPPPEGRTGESAAQIQEESRALEPSATSDVG